MTWDSRWTYGRKGGVPGWYPWWWRHGTHGENCVKWSDFFPIKEHSVLWKYLKPNSTAPSKDDFLWSSEVRDVRMNQCTQIKYFACYISRIKGKTLVPPLNVENHLTKSPYLHNKAIYKTLAEGMCFNTRKGTCGRVITSVSLKNRKLKTLL